MSDDAIIRIGYDNAKVREGAAKTQAVMNDSAKNIESRFAKLGNFIGGAVLVEKGRAALDYFARVQDQAEKLNATAESIQHLDMFGKATGTDAEQIVNSLLKMNKALSDPENDKGRKALDDLGISIQDLVRMQPDQAISALNEAFQKAQESGKGFHDIYDLLGKSAGDIIPLLRMSREEMDKLSSTPVLGDDKVKQLHDVNVQLGLMGQNITIGVGGALAAMGKGIEIFSRNVTGCVMTLAEVPGVWKKSGDFGDFSAQLDLLFGKLTEVNEAVAKPKVAPNIIDPAQSRKSKLKDDSESFRAGNELALLEARAGKHTKLTQELEKQARIQEKAFALQQQFDKMTPEQAMDIAKTAERMRDRIERPGVIRSDPQSMADAKKMKDDPFHGLFGGGPWNHGGKKQAGLTPADIAKGMAKNQKPQDMSLANRAVSALESMKAIFEKSD